MNKYALVFVLGAFVMGLFAVSFAPDQPAVAGSSEKIHFTQTITSSQDPGQGSEGQIAIVLSPSEGTIYDGSMTFTSSQPVQVLVLHEIHPNDAKGQPTWTVNGKKIYGISLMGMSKSDSFEFTGAALALYSPKDSQFTATVSVDGWVRGQPTEIIVQKLETKTTEPFLLLAKTNVAATIPMHRGIHDGGSVFYIMTDSSDQEFAKKISESQGWRVEHAPPIVNAPQDVLQKIFVFTNGVRGDGLYGYQDEVFSSTPEEPQYNALNSITEVTWKRGQNEIVFESAPDVLEAHERGRVEFNETGIVVNVPQIVWPGGQMTVRQDSEITDDMQYSGGQITKVDRDKMKVTFVAHRGWGPDGRTIYHIITDATPSGPANVLGVIHSPASDKLITSSAASDLFEFQNGIRGSGSLGFQGFIAGASAGDKNYSPMWRVYTVEWNDPKTAKVLETRYDIDSSKQEGLLSVSIARPMNSNYLINTPFIDPFQ